MVLKIHDYIFCFASGLLNLSETENHSMPFVTDRVRQLSCCFFSLRMQMTKWHDMHDTAVVLLYTVLSTLYKS